MVWVTSDRPNYMSASDGEGHGFSEEGQPILQMFISPSSEAQRPRRSPITPVIRSPGLRLYLSPSFPRSASTRLRNPPTARASSSHAHTAVDASGPPIRSRKRKLTSDVWDDFTPIFDEDGRLMQGQCIHCDAIFQTDKQFGTSQCRRHRLGTILFLDRQTTSETCESSLVLPSPHLSFWDL